MRVDVSQCRIIGQCEFPSGTMWLCSGTGEEGILRKQENFRRKREEWG